MLNDFGYIDAAVANINPMMETALSVFNQALKYLALERTVNFGASIVKYYDPQPGGDEKNAAYLRKYRPLVKCL